MIPREKWRSKEKKTEPQQAEKQEAEQGNAGVEERRRAMVFGKIPVTASRGILFLEIAQIVYAETDGHGCVVHTTSSPMRSSSFWENLRKSWPDFGFFRIHKSYLINLSFISELFAGSGNGLSVHMKGYESQGTPGGKRKTENIKQLLKIS